MNKKEIFSRIEGFAQAMRDAQVSRQFGGDHRRDSVVSSRLVERLHPKKLVLRISEVIDEIDEVKTFRLVPIAGQLPPFEAGQYINLSINADGVTTSRAYSISSSPSQRGHYDITVKRSEGGFVSGHLLASATTGDTLESTGPGGEFHYNPLFHGSDLVMLAGGAGITPLMSMIRHFADRGFEKRVHLMYVCRTPAHVIFNDELERLTGRFENFSFTRVISRPAPDYQGLTGHINAALLQSQLESVDGKTFYICGPTDMCNAARDDLVELGVRRGRIRQENFGESSAITEHADWPGDGEATSVTVRVVGGATFEAPVGEPLLNSLDRAGITVPSSCHSGDCSLCRVKLVDGKVYQMPGSKERVSDKQYGYIHSCSAYPTGDISILI